MRAVVFDLDGTLADTSGDLLAAANACFQGLGVAPQLTAADAGVALRGGRAMLRLGFSRVSGFDEAEVARQYPVLLAAYEADIDTHTTLYPGVIDAVDRLRVAGTVVVSYSPVSGGANAGASLRMRYVPRDDAYVKCALEVLRANAIAEDIVGSSLTHVGSSGEETRSRFLRLVRKTKRLASSAALVADLAPIPIPDGADDVPFLR